MRDKRAQLPMRIGHRGAAGYAPENTLTALAKAIQLGADMAEFDVQRTKDDELVVIHDKRVDRTTYGKGRVSDMKLSELRKLVVKVDEGFRKLLIKEDERIPTLEEILISADGHTGLMLEIISTGAGKEVHDMVLKTGFKGRVIYASFLHSELRDIRDADAGAETLALLEGVPVRPAAFAKDAKVTHVGLAIDSITEPFVRALHSERLAVFVYTVNHSSDIAWTKSMRVEGIISDFPDRL
jgi:glycerophosphoryl diester phosphodiesterase